VKSEDNKADVHTKNVNSSTFRKHTCEYMVNMEEDEKETENEGRMSEDENSDENPAVKERSQT
jgi:hypothetical protein